MRTIFLIFALFFLSTNCFSQEKYHEDTVQLNDTTYIYYFDFFNDHRVFDWDTIPKNFNFNNYRFYFKNNSSDTLWRGRVSTGDGRVTYYYAGNQQMILPDEYFIIKPMHNGDLRYRYWRFSRSVQMSANIYRGDSAETVHARHRYLGWYSKDSNLVEQPRIKLDEPFNPGPDIVENRLKRERYIKSVEVAEERKRQRKAERELKLKTETDSLQQLDAKKEENRNIVQNQIKEKKVLDTLYLELLYRGKKLEENKKVFMVFDKDTLPLYLITSDSLEGYYQILNSKLLREGHLLVKNENGYVYHETTLGFDKHPYIKIKFSGKTDHYGEYRPYLNMRPKYQPREPEKRDFTISILDGDYITHECEMQVLEENKWTKLSYDSSYGRGVYRYSTFGGDETRKLRWKRKSETGWHYNWLYLNRYENQLISEEKKVNFYSTTGAFHLNPIPKTYKLISSLRKSDLSKNDLKDSIKEVFRWYGIPYKSISSDRIVLESNTDLARTKRALKRHFDEGIELTQIYWLNKEETWLCGTFSIQFVNGTSKDDALSLLTNLGFKNIYPSSFHENNQGRLEIILENASQNSLMYKLKKLYPSPFVYAINLRRCQPMVLDTPLPDIDN